MPATLRRAVSRWQIVGMSLNGIVGSGVYLLPAAAAALLGSASVWAVPLAGLAVLLLALCYAEAGSHFEEPGAGYLYARAAFGEFAGFQVGWMLWLARLASAAALLNALAQAMTFIAPGATEGVARVAIVTVPLVAFGAINIAGIQHAARVEVALTIAKILPLLLLVALSFPVLDWSLVLPITTPDALELGTASALLLYAYAGFENTAAAAGEFRNPRRDVPFALVTVIGATTALYTLVQVAALGVVPDLAARDGGAPLADLAAILVGSWGGTAVTLAAIAAIAGTTGNTLLAGSRYLYALASAGFGPTTLARVHPRFRTPAWAVVVQLVVVGALALSGSFVQLAMLSVVARLFTYIGTAAAVPLLRRKFAVHESTIVLPGGATIPVLALFLCIGFLTSARLGDLFAGVIALAVGTAIYLAGRRTRELRERSE